MDGRQFSLFIEIIKVTLAVPSLFFYLLFSQAAFAQPPVEGLIAHWSFDEGSGTTAQDSAGNNTGTLYNGPSWVTGRAGYALSLDGINDYVEINDNNDLDLTGGEFTLSAWIYPESYGGGLNGRIIDHGGGSEGSGGWSLLVNDYQNSSNLRLSTKDENTWNHIYSNINSIGLNTWQHVAVTMGSGTVTFYVNGQIAGQASDVPAPTDRNSPVRIGMRATDVLRAFTGVIDDVRMYDRALSYQEIINLYNLFPPLSDTTPPVISNGQPVGVLPLETSAATLSVTTDEASICKYSLSPDTPYSSMGDTFLNGGTTHTHPISGLEYVQSRTYYIRCRDQSGNSSTTDYPVSFSFDRTVYSVSTSGSDGNPGTDALPLKTIQRAIHYAGGNNSDDIIIKVASGTYYENISIVCCSFATTWQLLGGWDSEFNTRDDNPSLTVIDGGGWQRAITINVPELDLTINGFTVKNGFDPVAGGGIAVFPFYHGTMTLNLVNNIIAHNSSGSAGGGVYISSKEHASTTLTLDNNVIANNHADYNGGGVCVLAEDSAGTAVTFIDNIVIGNSAMFDGGPQSVCGDGQEGSVCGDGGGIYLRSLSGSTITSTFIDNAITDNSSAYFGAGVFAYAESGATLAADFTHNRITGNNAPYLGGGVYLHSASSSTLTTGFTDNTISGNAAAIHGGGVYELSSQGATFSSSFTNNKIEKNSADHDGGGVFIWGTAVSTSAHNVITGNTAYRGGGMYATEGAVLTFTNDTITENRAVNPGAGIAGDTDTTTEMINTIIWGNDFTDAEQSGTGNVNISHSDIGSGTYNDDGTNFNTTPLFSAAGHWDNNGTPLDTADDIWIPGNYHLSSSSPLINKGDNSAVNGIGSDFEGDPRIMYGTVDIGADEHVFSLIKSDIVPQIDGDASEYAGTDSITFTSSTGDNSVTLKALWNDEALYLAHVVSDTKLNASITARDGNIMNEDSAGFMIDTLNNDGGSEDPDTPYMLEDDYLMLVNIRNAQYDSRGTLTGAPTTSWDGSWQSAVQFSGTVNDNSDIDTGYTVEMKIPWTDMYTPAPSGDPPARIGFLLYDKDDSYCDVDAAGTYIDAEYFTHTQNEQGDFSEETALGGYLNSGYLKSLLPQSQNIFTDQVPLNAYVPATPYEIGVRWTSDVDGYVTGVRFYKHSSNTNTHKGRLWQGPTLLANTTFVLDNPSASGWQTVYFDSPVFINAGVTYTVTINRVSGYYYQNNNYFGAVNNPPLHVSAGQSGVYRSGPASSFECPPPCTPAQYPDTPINSNYWVDVVFAQSVPSCSDITGREYKKYELEFPAGTYTVWLRGYAVTGADTVLVGVDDSCVGTYEFTTKNQWAWSNTAVAGANSTGALSSGTHHIDIWSRQADVLIDGIYLTTGDENPTDVSHGKEIDPANCSTSSYAMWPETGGTAVENASNWQEVRLSVLTYYYCDYDHDGHMASVPSSACVGTGCQPVSCRLEAGTDCDDNDFYEHPGQAWYKDADNDEHSDGTSDLTSCTRPPGYKAVLELMSVSDDCNDTDAFIYPWAPEIWYDGVDQDCDGWNDYDRDMDYYVHENWNAEAGGLSTGTDDCNDMDPAIHPDTRWCPDADGDGFGNPAVCFVQCSQPDNFVMNNLDCNDNDPNIYPGGPSVRMFGGIFSYFFLIQEAYDAAHTGDTIQCQDALYTEDLFFDLDKSVFLEGGYDCAYSITTGTTTLNGSITITDGAATIENIELQPSFDYKY